LCRSKGEFALLDTEARLLAALLAVCVHAFCLVSDHAETRPVIDEADPLSTECW